MSSQRMIAFLAIVLTVWTGLHIYVFARLATVPWVAVHTSGRGLMIVAALLWSAYPLGRFLDGRGLEWLGTPS